MLVGMVNGGRRPVEDVTRRLFSQQPALQHALGQFLDKQGHAVGAVGDLLDDDLRECLAGDLGYQRDPVAPVQAVERQHRYPRLANPVCLELGTKRHDQ